MKLRKLAYRAYRRFMLDHFHYKMVDHDWLRWKGYKVDWEHPRDINEKIQWLMCFSDTSLWSECADKVRIRDFVKERGLEHLLVPCLGIWGKAEDIDFDALPEKFVIKCNHDSGSTIIVDKAKGFDADAIRHELAAHLKVKYGYAHGEMYYNDIRPKIIAEQFLEQKSPVLPGRPIDYKVWCFDGKPYSIWACHSRTREGTYVNIYDLQWNVHPEYSVFTSHYMDGEGKVPRPENLEEMLGYASILSKGFPEVRVDFYIIDGRIYFGELTFASICAKMDIYTDEYLKELGDQCVLPGKK